VDSQATVGGGAFPTARIPSSALALAADAADAERRLRLAATPVIGRIAHDRLHLDLRSVPAAHDETLVAAVTAALS
jgi:L-seryl-tRNA(Ser) seleniumtransferase